MSTVVEEYKLLETYKVAQLIALLSKYSIKDRSKAKTKQEKIDLLKKYYESLVELKDVDDNLKGKKSDSDDKKGKKSDSDDKKTTRKNHQSIKKSDSDDHNIEYKAYAKPTVVLQDEYDTVSAKYTKPNILYKLSKKRYLEPARISPFRHFVCELPRYNGKNLDYKFHNNLSIGYISHLLDMFSYSTVSVIPKIVHPYVRSSYTPLNTVKDTTDIKSPIIDNKIVFPISIVYIEDEKKQIKDHKIVIDETLKQVLQEEYFRFSYIMMKEIVYSASTKKRTTRDVIITVDKKTDTFDMYDVDQQPDTVYDIREKMLSMLFGRVVKVEIYFGQPDMVPANTYMMVLAHLKILNQQLLFADIDEKFSEVIELKNYKEDKANDDKGLSTVISYDYHVGKFMMRIEEDMMDLYA